MKLSVLIAAINEEAKIAASISSAFGGGASEVIVSDGGSTDRTTNVAKAGGARVIHSEQGRALQFNSAARLAIGEVILFLHADCILPPDFAEQIENALKQGAQCGVFRQRIDSDRFIFRLIELGNTWRVRLRNLAYGDQGIWIKKRLFHDLGEFPTTKLMEDYLFSETLRQKQRYSVLKGPLLISPRRWESQGVIRQTLLNWTIIRRYRRGASPDELAKVYRRHDQ
ncbi:MAG: TIGR04283 family arsenosugar biosynthesis glycosyltransferase [Pirellulaceae bacterium]